MIVYIHHGDEKGQRRGLCGHIMASFDLHIVVLDAVTRAMEMMTVLRKDLVLFVTGSLKLKRKCLLHPHIKYVKKRNGCFSFSGSSNSHCFC